MNYTEQMLKKKEQWLLKNNELLMSGVCIMDINTVYIDADVEVGKNTVIYPNVYIEKGSKVGSGVTILSNSFISNAIIGNNCIVDSSRITDSLLGDESAIGPMSHLRNKTQVIGNARIGNFVEMKNTVFGEGSKCAHLTYLGDSDVGKNVNFGCGVVTVNYDGKHKFRTTIKDGAFIGSNVNLIAPVVIGENALLAAGSTINKDVADGDMGIARPMQENRTGFGSKYKNK